MSDVRDQRILRQHVHTDALLGVAAVPVRADEARRAASAAKPPSSSPSSPPARADVNIAVSAEAPSAAVKLHRLEQLDRDEVRGCTKCALCHTRTQTVFGEGDPDARLMFVGEGPGQTEDETGRPFVGRAGELLDKQIAAMGLKREQVFIANIVKCRPPENRTPAPDEVAQCFGYLVRQIEIIRPAVIVTLGGPATKAMLDTKEGITRIRGTWHTFDALALRGGPSIPVMPTFHPAYLLRSYTVENRKKVWSDLQAVMEKLGLTAGR